MARIQTKTVKKESAKRVFFFLYGVAKWQWLVWKNLNREPQSRDGFGGEQLRPTCSGESGEAQWGKMNSNIITSVVLYCPPLIRRNPFVFGWDLIDTQLLALPQAPLSLPCLHLQKAQSHANEARQSARATSTSWFTWSATWMKEIKL